MEKTIAAIATGNAAGGIGVIRISGEKAIQIADKVFKAQDGSSLLSLKGYRAKFGNVVCKGEQLDNAVALVFRAPKSYTGEDVVDFLFTVEFLLLRELWKQCLQQELFLHRQANLRSVHF